MARRRRQKRKVEPKIAVCIDRDWKALGRAAAAYSVCTQPDANMVYMPEWLLKLAREPAIKIADIRKARRDGAHRKALLTAVRLSRMNDEDE